MSTSTLPKLNSLWSDPTFFTKRATEAAWRQGVALIPASAEQGCTKLVCDQNERTTCGFFMYLVPHVTGRNYRMAEANYDHNHPVNPPPISELSRSNSSRLEIRPDWQPLSRAPTPTISEESPDWSSPLPPVPMSRSPSRSAPPDEEDNEGLGQMPDFGGGGGRSRSPYRLPEHFRSESESVTMRPNKPPRPPPLSRSTSLAVNDGSKGLPKTPPGAAPSLRAKLGFLGPAGPAASPKSAPTSGPMKKGFLGRAPSPAGSDTGSLPSSFRNGGSRKGFSPFLKASKSQENLSTFPRPNNFEDMETLVDNPNPPPSSSSQAVVLDKLLEDGSPSSQPDSARFPYNNTPRTPASAASSSNYSINRSVTPDSGRSFSGGSGWNHLFALKPKLSAKKKIPQQVEGDAAGGDGNGDGEEKESDVGEDAYGGMLATMLGNTESPSIKRQEQQTSEPPPPMPSKAPKEVLWPPERSTPAIHREFVHDHGVTEESIDQQQPMDNNHHWNNQNEYPSGYGSGSGKIKSHRINDSVSTSASSTTGHSHALSSSSTSFKLSAPPPRSTSKSPSFQHKSSPSKASVTGAAAASSPTHTVTGDLPKVKPPSRAASLARSHTAKSSVSSHSSKSSKSINMLASGPSTPAGAAAAAPLSANSNTSPPAESFPPFSSPNLSDAKAVSTSPSSGGSPATITQEKNNWNHPSPPNSYATIPSSAMYPHYPATSAADDNTIFQLHNPDPASRPASSESGLAPVIPLRRSQSIQAQALLSMAAEEPNNGRTHFGIQRSNTSPSKSELLQRTYSRNVRPPNRQMPSSSRASPDRQIPNGISKPDFDAIREPDDPAISIHVDPVVTPTPDPSNPDSRTSEMDHRILDMSEEMVGMALTTHNDEAARISAMSPKDIELLLEQDTSSSQTSSPPPTRPLFDRKQLADLNQQQRLKDLIQELPPIPRISNIAPYIPHTNITSSPVLAPTAIFDRDRRSPSPRNLSQSPAPSPPNSQGETTPPAPQPSSLPVSRPSPRPSPTPAPLSQLRNVHQKSKSSMSAMTRPRPKNPPPFQRNPSFSGVIPLTSQPPVSLATSTSSTSSPSWSQGVVAPAPLASKRNPSDSSLSLRRKASEGSISVRRRPSEASVDTSNSSLFSRPTTPSRHHPPSHLDPDMPIADFLASCPPEGELSGYLASFEKAHCSTVAPLLALDYDELRAFISKDLDPPLPILHARLIVTRIRGSRKRSQSGSVTSPSDLFPQPPSRSSPNPNLARVSDAISVSDFLDEYSR